MPPIFGPRLLRSNGCIDKDATWYGWSFGLRDIVLDRDPGPPPLKVHSPQFSANVRCGQTAGWIKMPLGTEVNLDSGDIVLDGVAAPSRRGTVFASCLL